MTDRTTTAEPSTVTLADGRMLAYATHGAADGPWVVHHHGTGASRLEGALFDEVARAAGVRLLTIDRPSYGGSSAADERTLASWPADVVAVADALGIDRFGVSGLSGGGPHALAVAAALPERVTHVVIINSGGPTWDAEVLADSAKRDVRVWTMARDRPDRFLRFVSPTMSKEPNAFTELLAKVLLPKLDRELLAEPTIRATMEASSAEGRRQPGNRFDEALLIWGGSWGFDPYTITMPVTVFSGAEDQGRAFNRKLAATTPHGTLDEYPGGHLAFVAGDVMQRIARAMRG